MILFGIIFKKDMYKDFLNYSSVLFNKFFIFCLNYYCLNRTKENVNTILLSQSTLITIYLTMSDLIITGINSIFKDNQTLLFFQTILSGFVYFIYFIVICISSSKYGRFITYFNGVCLCKYCCCEKMRYYSCCYCQYCNDNCSYHENCKCFICEYCND